MLRRKDSVLPLPKQMNAQPKERERRERERATVVAEQHAAEASSKAEGFRLNIAKAIENAAEANRGLPGSD